MEECFNTLSREKTRKKTRKRIFRVFKKAWHTVTFMTCSNLRNVMHLDVGQSGTAIVRKHY